MINSFSTHFKKYWSNPVGWLMFLFVVYLILFIKLGTTYYLNHTILFNLYSILIAVYILSRFILAYFHKNIPSDMNYEPTVSFVVPAKNEEENINETIRKFTQVDYPREKVDIVAVNDGSTDNTYREMRLAQLEGEAKGFQIEVLNWKINRGKREGMAEGVRRSRGDIVIFVDSDSFVQPDCVRHLVKYFARPAVGAVSGHTDVYNKTTNLLTKMQSVRYYIAFRIYKAAESVFGSVTCCPGCCSAYRRSYLMPILSEWRSQSFFGVRCTFGDDRSLTNFIIKKYDAVYSPQALAKTVVPDTFNKYVRQQQRWKKSWIRETLIASTFMWRKNVVAATSFYSYMLLAVAAPIVFIRAMIYYPIIQSHTLPLPYLLGLGLMLVLHGLYYRNRVHDFGWFLPVVTFWFYTVMLMWQLPWAMITMRDSRWGTR